MLSALQVYDINITIINIPAITPIRGLAVSTHRVGPHCMFDEFWECLVAQTKKRVEFFISKHN